MAVASIMSNHFKYALASGMINLASDDLKILLMKDGFTFDKDAHKTLKNLKGTITGNADIDFSATGNTITTGGGNFLDAGFVVGNFITITGTTNNNISCRIVTVDATTMTVDATLVDETGTSATITADDELSAANGYTQLTSIGTITLTEDDVNDRLVATFPTVVWTATGGNIGPTSGAVIYDDTSADDTIVGYIDFGSSQTATDGETFTIAAGSIEIL